MKTFPGKESQVEFSLAFYVNVQELSELDFHFSSLQEGKILFKQGTCMLPDSYSREWPGIWGQSPQVVFGLFFISNWSRPLRGPTGESVCSLVTESVNLRAFTPREVWEEMVYIVWPSVSCEEILFLTHQIKASLSRALTTHYELPFMQCC